MQISAANLPIAAWGFAEQATGLIERYPDLTSEEINTLVAIYPMLPPLHLALMASDEDLAPRLEAFRKAHRRRIRTPFRHYVAFLIPLLMMVVVLVWWAIK
jgi:hypothetical protein